MSESSKKPNILFITTDQHNNEMLSCAGNPYVKTPNMDYLAANGVRFTDAYCSNPVCLPARFSMNTGIYPGAVGCKDNLFMGKVPDLVVKNAFGNLLRQNGYNTAYSGIYLGSDGMSLDEIGFENIGDDWRDECA